MPPELLVQALEMQARLLELQGCMRVTLEVLVRLLVLQSLEWKHVRLVSGWAWAVGKERCCGLRRGRSCSALGWTCAGRRTPLRLARRACTSLRKRLWPCAL